MKLLTLGMKIAGYKFEELIICTVFYILWTIFYSKRWNVFKRSCSNGFWDMHEDFGTPEHWRAMWIGHLGYCRSRRLRQIASFVLQTVLSKNQIIARHLKLDNTYHIWNDNNFKHHFITTPTKNHRIHTQTFKQYLKCISK